MHYETFSPLVSVNTLCLAPAALDEQVRSITALGADAIFTERTDVEAFGVARTGRLLADARLPLAGLTHRAFGFSTPAEVKAQRDRLFSSIEIAQQVGSPALCMTTGGRGDLPWREAAARFVDAIAPCVEAAEAAKVKLAIEPTSHLYADASIAHRLRDVVTLADAAGVQVGLDIFPCWVDADLDEAIDAAGPICAFVQLSDYVLGDRGLPCRAIPGDGAVPVQAVIRRVIATGFKGPFDIEVIGPRLELDRMGSLRRAVDRVKAWIQDALAADPNSPG